MDAALPFAEQHDWIYTTVGIHPTKPRRSPLNISTNSPAWRKHPKVIAWGEIGLDYFYDHSPRDTQATRLPLSKWNSRAIAKLPIIIHCRDAWDDCLRLNSKKYWSPTALGGILHCFTGTLDQAKRGLEWASHFFRRQLHLSQNAKSARCSQRNSHRPHPHRNRFALPGPSALPRQTQRARLCCGSGQNPRRCEKLASGRIAAATAANFRRFFRIARPDGFFGRIESPIVLTGMTEGRAQGRSAIALLTAKEIFDLVRDDLVLVEQELSRQSATAYQPVAEITSYLLGGGGKRLRPALLLLSIAYAGENRPGAIRLAAVVELLHSATLIHDDVIDSADTRRGRPSANSRWGNHRSVLAGDWLYMQSFQMALEERNFRILDMLIDLTQKMVEGELIQLEKIGRIDVTEEDALQLATYKTACLFSGCARLGAVLGGLSGDEEESLADYGRYSGLAFQMVDDLLDFTASAEQLGKPVLSDLKEGKVTIPLIYAMENGHRDARALVSQVLKKKISSRSARNHRRPCSRIRRTRPRPRSGPRLRSPRQSLL